MNKKHFSLGWIQFYILIIFILVLFYFNAYKFVLQNGSSSFSLQNLIHISKNYKAADIVILGDSTAAEDFRVNKYNRENKDKKAINMGLPGSWLFLYHKLQLITKNNNKNLNTAILILGPDSFSYTGNSRIELDLEYAKADLNPFDTYLLWLYSDSFNSFANNLAALILKPVLFKSDLEDLIKYPKRRLTQIPANYSWLTRKISPQEPLWEDTRNFNVCKIGSVDKLQNKYDYFVKKNNAAEITRLTQILASYNPRKNLKYEINKDFEKRLALLLKELSTDYEKVFILNAPIYKDFEDIYKKQYLNDIVKLTKTVSENYKNVQYIPNNDVLTNDCSNFMDIIHLNAKGADEFTGYIMQNLDK